MGEHDGFDVPMQRFSEAEVTTRRDAAVRRVGGDRPVQLPVRARRPVRRAPRSSPATPCIIKPSEIGSLCGHLVYDAFVDGGVPPGVVNLVTGAGDEAGAALVGDNRLDGLTFTGSSAVGMSIIQSFSSSHPKPAICEMGGKNPVIVAASADLALAVEGTARAAFGFGGQKCSAASRVFVDESLVDEFCDRLVTRAEAIPPRRPLERDGFLSPVVDAAAIERYEAVVADARLTGEVLCGGNRLTDGDLARGNFVAPTVVRVPDDSMIWDTELFVPLIAVRSVASLDEALERANAVPFGLTAGLFATDRVRDRPLPRPHRGRRRLRQPCGGRHDRCLARRAAVRRLEALGHRRQGRRRPVLPAAVPARAVPHHRLVDARSTASWSPPAPPVMADVGDQGDGVAGGRWVSAAEQRQDAVDGEAGGGVAVDAGDRVGDEQGVGDGLLGGVDDGGEDVVQRGVADELDRDAAGRVTRQAVGGRDGAEDVAAAVVGDRADPRQPEPDAAGDARRAGGRRAGCR